MVLETVSCDHPFDVRFPSTPDTNPIHCPNKTAEPQTITLAIPYGIPRLAFWTSSVLSNYDDTDWFIRQGDLQVETVSGLSSVTFSLAPDTMATLTTQLSLGQKGKAIDPIPPAAPFPTTISLAFNETPLSTKTPPFLLDQRGVFEMVPFKNMQGDGRVLAQVVPESEVVWIGGPRRPTTIVGDWDWTDYSVATVAMIAEGSGITTDYVSVGGRVNSSGIGVGGNNPDSGYFLSMYASGAWDLSREQVGGPYTLANGTVAESVVGYWSTLKLEFKNQTISAYINGSMLAYVVDDNLQSAYLNGWASLACGWNLCWYQSLTVNAA